MCQYVQACLGDSNIIIEPTIVLPKPKTTHSTEIHGKRQIVDDVQLRGEPPHTYTQGSHPYAIGWSG
jgi:hypothetical protein